MDILLDKPMYSNSPGTNDEKQGTAPDVPSYIHWLDSGRDERPVLQVILVRILEAQVSPHRRNAWTKLPFRILYAIYEAAFKSVQGTLLTWRSQIAESRLFQCKAEPNLPKHSTCPPSLFSLASFHCTPSKSAS